MIGSAIGIACYAAIVAAAAWAIAVYARRHGLLAPVLVGAGVRLGVLVIAHAGTVSLGDGGLMFVDDATYATAASEIADAWRGGDLVYPGAYELAGSYQFGYPTLVAVVFVLLGDHILFAKLLNILFGAATVLVAGLIAQDVLGRTYARRAAWLVAFAPGVIWWSVPLLKEALATFLVALAVLAMLRLPKAWGVLAATLAFLVIVRSSSAIVLLACLAVALLLAARQAGVSVSVRAVASAAFWLLIAGLGILTVLAAGNPGQLVESYAHTVQLSIDTYRGSVALVPLDAVKSLVTPLPWAFDPATQNWDRGLYPGMWVWYVAYPLAALGAWRLRHRPELAVLALPILLAVLLNSFTSGFEFRQRSVVEPLVVILACAGIANWRQALRYGAAALAVVAMVAAAHSGPVTGLAIAGGAAALLSATRFASAADLRADLPPSPLTGQIASLGDAWRGLTRRAAALQRSAPRPQAVKPIANADRIGRRLRAAAPSFQYRVPGAPRALPDAVVSLRAAAPSFQDRVPGAPRALPDAVVSLRAAAPSVGNGAAGARRALAYAVVRLLGRVSADGDLAPVDRAGPMDEADATRRAVLRGLAPPRRSPGDRDVGRRMGSRVPPS